MGLSRFGSLAVTHNLISKLEGRYDTTTLQIIRDFLQVLPHNIINHPHPYLNSSKFTNLLITSYEDDMSYSMAFDSESDLWENKGRGENMSQATPAEEIKHID